MALALFLAGMAPRAYLVYENEKIQTPLWERRMALQAEAAEDKKRKQAALSARVGAQSAASRAASGAGGRQVGGDAGAAATKSTPQSLLDCMMREHALPACHNRDDEPAPAA